MSKFKVNVGKFVERNTKELINKIVARPEVLEPAAKIALNEVKLSILKVKEPETGQPFAKPEITEEWQLKKRELRKTNPPFDSAAGGRSKKARLIFTGQWINSFNYFITKPGFFSFFGSKPVTIEVRPDGTHEPYKDAEGKKIGKRIKNQKLGKYLAEQGRNWIGLPPKIRARVTKLIQSQIRRELTKRKK